MSHAFVSNRTKKIWNILHVHFLIFSLIGSKIWASHRIDTYYEAESFGSMCQTPVHFIFSNAVRNQQPYYNQWILKSFITPCIECPWFFKKSFQLIQAINLVFFSMGGENLFKDAIEHTANLNMRMGIERKLRLPFLDSQTGVAQSHTSLWHPYRDRQPGLYWPYHYWYQ